MTIVFSKASVCVDNWFSGSGISDDLRMVILMKIRSPFDCRMEWVPFNFPKDRDALYKIIDMMELQKSHGNNIWFMIHNGPSTIAGPINFVDTEDHVIELGFIDDKIVYPEIKSTLFPIKPPDSALNLRELIGNGSNSDEIEIGGITIHLKWAND